MGRLRVLPAVWVVVSLAVGACSVSSNEPVVPEGWTTIPIGDGLVMGLPADATPVDGVPVDSSAGVLEGSGYLITYDVGSFGESLDDHRDEQEFSERSTDVGGLGWTVVSFVPSDEDAVWAEVAQADLGRGRTVTIRVSCDQRQACDRLMDQLVASVSSN